MLYTAAFACLHVSVHVLLYALPRWLWIVCVRWPLQVLSVLLGIRFFTHDPKHERRVHILGLTGSSSLSPRVCLRDRFGITEAQLSNLVLHHKTASSSSGDASPAWWRYNGPLYNGHVHTILGALRPLLDLRVPARETVPSYDGNPTCLDWWFPTDGDTAATAASGGAAIMCVRALVVILPGLMGSSREFYVRRMARQLLRSNMVVCVLNARGVADTPLERPQIFSALFTKDLRHIMQTHLTREKVQERLLRRIPPLQTDDINKGAVPIIGVGFSLGGLILTNYVSEQGEAQVPSGFDAVYSITSPHNVSDSAAALRMPLARLLYNSALHKGPHAYYERHKHVLQHLPGVDKKIFMDDASLFVERLRTLQDFDELITGPHFGYPGAEAYYAAASSFLRLHHSRTPQVCIVAANDPICGPPQPTPRWLQLIDRHRGGLVYVEMPVGGHLGFLGCPWSEWTQAPNEMERFVLHSLIHFIESADTQAKAAKKIA
ncbi:hypothetical protein LPMP_110850 [Leishmania panamensis]|uniref:Alpha/beta hydrolase family, putative n=1 Tax=Leishmania panamensis TaxID=5679 RepID=A0A088RKD5_LEIPA|nr:hypothetical protein LPMP_110850 [Leishmania panamensis]AIN96280.1 hypothetical protein LPMP_110850 [Leishmania panamensis]